MPATVNVNFLTVVHKSSDGVSFCFPDVCKTPTPAGPIPIPYPNIAMSKDTAQGSQTVTMDGNPIMLKGSVYATSTGDEAGSVGGVVSNVIKGKAEFLNYSFDVKVEGKNVCRLLDPMGQNESSPANGLSPATIQPPLVVLAAAATVTKKKLLTARVIKVEFNSGIDLWTTDKKKKADEQVPPAGKPHWEVGKKKYPACYIRDGAAGVLGRKLKVTLEITTELSGTATLSAKGSGKGFDVEVEGTQTVSASKTKQQVTFDCEFKKLPKTVKLLKNWRFAWLLELAGEKRNLNATLLTLYIVDENPKPVTWPDPNHNWYDWVLEYSCRWADGKTGPANVFDAIWNKFSTGTAARVPHETGWSYWKTGNPAQQLLESPYKASTDGWSCRAICHFFMMAVSVHGIACEDVEPRGASGTPFDLFMVAEWTFSGAGGQAAIIALGGGPGYYYAGKWKNDATPPKALPDHPGWTRDAVRKAAPGQGQNNPPLGFINHWIVDMKAGRTGLHDTSYGGSMKATMLSYQGNAISGWLAGVVTQNWIIVPATHNTLIKGGQSGRAHT